MRQPPGMASTGVSPNRLERDAAEEDLDSGSHYRYMYAWESSTVGSEHAEVLGIPRPTVAIPSWEIWPYEIP